MAGWDDQMAALVLDASLVAACWSGLLALVMVGCRQPARRWVLVQVANLGLLAIWPLILLLPLPRIDARALLRPFLPPASVGIAAPGTSPRPGEAGSAVITDGVRLVPRDDLPSARLPWTRAAVIGYGLGVGLVAARLALGSLVAAWLGRRGVLPRASSLHMLDALASQGRSRRPRLRVSARIGGPILVGVLRPTILIPPHLERAVEAERLGLSLCHELVHAERRDPACRLLAGVAQALWFFLPHVGWMHRQMRIDREYLVDQETSRRLGAARASYARSLVEIAAGPGAVPGGANEPARGRGVLSTMALRVLMLVRCPYPIEDRAPSWWRWAVCALATCAVLAGSTLTLRGVDASARGGTDAASSAATSVRIDHLTVVGDPDRDDDATYFLPVTLPSRFDLAFEIQVRPIDLPLYAVAGFHVAPPFPEDSDTANWEDPPWLRVRLQRGAGGSPRAWVDGDVATVRPARGAATSRLSIQSPHGRQARIRRLVLSW